MRRSALQPPVGKEMEPGETLRQLFLHRHPFAREPDLDDIDKSMLKQIMTKSHQLDVRRTAKINFWLERARRLKQVSLDRIRNHPDKLIRNLLLKGRPEWADDYVPAWLQDTRPPAQPLLPWPPMFSFFFEWHYSGKAVLELMPDKF